jgi:hypothetical protein
MKKVTVPHLVMMIAGVVILLFSFFHFYSYSGGGTNAWGSGLFPLATLVVLYAVIVAGTLALQIFAGVQLPPLVLGFTWQQIRLVLSFFAALQMLAFLITDRGGLDLGIGFWFMFLGAAGLIVGAILERTMGDARSVVLGGGSAPAAGGTPPPPPPPPAG